ncbi:hypothetical protein CY34DRAFT_12161 [Suillus luteus UH-Slu-Lm8-n1]|uniref:Uncharacterized protein n=1 Tax=Suillus luteus UH-Slu-Lm8-n1 TaxID=930992 RepID=A0A0D0AYE3_9AGAM|nr:hypothetical protein CY34DRAFT_12161 [Suillus luteus UH-Slu-Lm8-n1]
MSDHGENSQATASSGPDPTTITETSSDLACVERCSELINQYRLGRNRKADTILELREILVDSPAVRSGRNLNEALDVFITMLDDIDLSNREAATHPWQHFKDVPTYC